MEATKQERKRLARILRVLLNLIKAFPFMASKQGIISGDEELIQKFIIELEQ